MKQQTVLLTIVLTFVLMLTSTEATGGQPSVSDQTVWLGDWDFVATLDGGRVDSFLALRDPSLAVGSNVTAVWFRLKDDRQWEALAWRDPGNLKAIAHVKVTLGLPDATDAIWPDASVAQAGGFVDPSLAIEPDAFATGVFADDSFAPVIEATSDPAPLVSALTSTGYPSASLPVQTQGCSQDDILSTMAAMVEADLGANGGAGAGGTIIADFSVSQTPCDLWQSVTAPLDNEGVWLVPDLAPWLEATAAIDPANAWQSIAVGIAFVGTQTVVIDAGGIDAAGDQVVAVKLVISIEDLTPPSLELELLGDDMPPMVSPGGLDYFIAPVTISVNHLALDNVDGVVIPSALNVEVFVDCTQVVDPGEPGGWIDITDTGYYTLRARVLDSAGNATYVSQMFEVRDRFNLEAAAVVESLTVTPGAGYDTVDATILLTSETFDPTTINLATFALWLTDTQNQQIGTAPLTLLPGYVVDGAYDPLIVNMDQGVWRLAVSGQIPPGCLSQPGIEFSITGSGLHGTPEEYDLKVMNRSFAVQADPIDALLTQATPSNTTSNPPPPPPAPHCKWKSEFVPRDIMDIQVFEPDGCTHIDVFMRAQPVAISGVGLVNSRIPCSSESFSDSVISGGRFTVRLEPVNCCNDCNISVSAQPYFYAKAGINPVAQATIGGVINIATPCGDTKAEGAIFVGDSDSNPSTISIGGFDIPVSFVDGAIIFAKHFSGNLECVHSGCSISASIVTIIYFSFSTQTNILNWYADAGGFVENASVGLSITPSSNGSCIIVNDGQSFRPPNPSSCWPWDDDGDNP